MRGLGFLRKLVVRYPLALLSLVAAVVLAYLIFVRETVFQENHRAGALLTAVITALGFLVDRLVDTVWRTFHERVSGGLLKMWRWLFDEHFRLSFFVTTIHDGPAPESEIVARTLESEGGGVKVTFQGDNYVAVRTEDAPFTFQISWNPVVLNEEALEHGLETEPKHGTELNISLSQDLVLGYRSGRKILDSLVNRYYQIEQSLRSVLSAPRTPNVFAEGAWFDGKPLGRTTKTLRDKTFSADIDIVGSTVHVRGSSTDALKSLYSHLGGLEVS